MQHVFVTALLAFVVFVPVAASAGTVRGVVTLKDKGTGLHNARVVLSPLGRAMETDNNGEYEFRNVPAGTYTVLAHMHALSDISKTVTVTADGVAVADFALSLEAVRDRSP